MKIWMINHYATPPNLGPSTRHYSLAKEMSKLGHEVTIVAADTHHFMTDREVFFECSPASFKFQNELLNLWTDGNVDFLFLKTANYKDNSVGRFWNMLSFTKEVLGIAKIDIIAKPDIIIGSSVHLFAVWAAQKLSKKYNVPFCFEVRDIWPKSLIDMQVIPKWHPLALILSFLEHKLYRKANTIITLLPYLNEYLAEFNVSEDKIVYIPNGVDLESFPSSDDISHSETSLTIMYLGAHGVANGLDTLLEAALDLQTNPASKPLVWKFIGDGPLKNQLIDKMLSMKLSNVTFENRIPRSHIPKLIANASILVVNLIDLDVYRYGISLNKIFDYLAAQRPIVFGSNARNDIISYSQSGITVPSEDPIAIAQAIRAISDMPLSEHIAMGKRGRKYVEENYSFTLLAKRLVKALDKVLEDFNS